MDNEVTGLRKNIQNWSNRTRKFVTVTAAVAMVAVGATVQAAELELPNAAEVQYFSPEAQQFYAAGVAALDKVDYINAYSLLTKAAALQPAAIRLNHISATIALYQGRQHPAEEAIDYYETALSNYENILRVPTLTGDLRRQVTNEMKLAQQERESLSQRDVLREASGTTFVMDYNRKYGKAPERVAGITAKDSPATTLAQEMLAPLMAAPGLQTPGMGTGFPGDPGLGMPMQGQPGMMPGAPMPGAPMPGQPGGVPGQPAGMPGQI